MADESSELGVEFISAPEDVAIRLECFRLAERGATDFASHVAQAEKLYNWVMGYEETTLDEVEAGTATGESACTRKH